MTTPTQAKIAKIASIRPLSISMYDAEAAFIDAARQVLATYTPEVLGRALGATEGQIVDLAEAMAAFDEHRESMTAFYGRRKLLREGKPCPLCGAEVQLWRVKEAEDGEWVRAAELAEELIELIARI